MAYPVFFFSTNVMTNIARVSERPFPQVQGITNDILQPGKITSEMHGTEPR